jgi:uncharacterized RDD family membrane protein YckC
MEHKERRVTIPLSPEDRAPVDHWARLREQSRAAGHDTRWMEPLSKRGQVIFVICVAVVLATASIVVIFRGQLPAMGWILLAASVVIVGALVWAVAHGGIDEMGRVTLFRSDRINQPHEREQNGFVAPSEHALAPSSGRVLARIIDLGVTLFVVLGVHAITEGFSKPLSLGLSVVAFLMTPPLLLWITNGRSPGKVLCGLRVLSIDGHPLKFGVCIKRETHAFASASDLPTLFFDTVNALTNRTRRTFADQSSGTVVVKTR